MTSKCKSKIRQSKDNKYNAYFAFPCFFSIFKTQIIDRNNFSFKLYNLFLYMKKIKLKSNLLTNKFYSGSTYHRNISYCYQLRPKFIELVTLS